MGIFPGIAWDLYVFLKAQKYVECLLCVGHFLGTGARVVNKTYSLFLWLFQSMLFNLHDNHTSSYYSHFMEEEIEIAVNTGQFILVYHQSWQLIQQDSFCFELFSACFHSLIYSL